MAIENPFFRAAFSVDNVIFGFNHGKLKILLIKRNEAPFKDMWALPGDLVHPAEDLDNAPIRVLKELTGLDNVFLEQVHTFGKKDRHPLGRVVTIAYYSLININQVTPKAASFAGSVEWHDIQDVAELAFDHNEIMFSCLHQLQKSIRTRPIGFELLPEKFTLSDLQELYEAILFKQLDKRNFRKKILTMGVLSDPNEVQKNVAHRPARIYNFDYHKYARFKEEGFVFEI
ncbi:MAG: NUDIX hydrolase [Saprospiraceae bacterium]|nr:NUDIX hydrolase [Saprospiraceae bacterium]